MSILSTSPVVPLIQADSTDVAVKTAKALKAGGLITLEIVWRNEIAMDCMEAISEEVSGITVGAGTVLTGEQAEEAVRRGAEFIVSPGLNNEVVAVSKANGLDIFPGIVTPSEAQAAWNLGLRTVKFFPASLSGGPAMLKALSSVFQHMQFMPTGGVTPANLGAYLEIPSVIACGGSWLTPASEIDKSNYDAITTLAKSALEIARGVRPEVRQT